jgi:hypothetical protein
LVSEKTSSRQLVNRSTYPLRESCGRNGRKILDRTTHTLETSDYEDSQIRSNETDGELAESVEEISPHPTVRELL